jgi:hypothetical protein
MKNLISISAIKMLLVLFIGVVIMPGCRKVDGLAMMIMAVRNQTMSTFQPWLSYTMQLIILRMLV